jgi:hypothetical protein
MPSSFQVNDVIEEALPSGFVEYTRLSSGAIHASITSAARHCSQSTVSRYLTAGNKLRDLQQDGCEAAAAKSPDLYVAVASLAARTAAAQTAAVLALAAHGSTGPLP